MAQSRERRKQRRKQRAPVRPATPSPSGPAVVRRRNLRRVVIAFLVLVGLAGILAISPSGDGPSGADVPIFERR